MMNSVSRLISAQKCTKNVQNLLRISTTSYSVDHKWKVAVKKGEKIVGYPTAFMNLRWLLTDEISDIAFYVSKLIGTKHPMMQVARDLIQQNDTAKWGLIILLVSKAAGIRQDIDDNEQDGLTGILHTQRSLAEIAEMIKTGHQMHSTMLNVKHEDENYNNLHFGNKLALLSGDYLYGKSFKELASLNNNDLNEIIATSLRDLSQAEFIALKDKNEGPLANRTKPGNDKKGISDFDSEPHDVDSFLGNAREEWILRNLLGSITLLAKSCKGALILGGHSEELQQKGFNFGRSLGLAWNLKEELRPFTQDTTLPFSLTSAPVLLQLEEEPEMCQLIQSNKYKEIRKRILSGEGLNKALDLQREFRKEAVDALSIFPTNDAHHCLVQMVKALSPSLRTCKVVILSSPCVILQALFNCDKFSVSL